MFLTARPWRLGATIGLAALAVGAVAVAVNWSTMRSPATELRPGAVVHGNPGESAATIERSRPGPVKLAPALPGPGAVAGDQQVEAPERVLGDMRVTQEMLSNLEETLVELRRAGKADEVAMVERKQAELRAKLSQAKERLERR